MYEELLPIGLVGAARRLGVEPLEVVRLMVVTDSVTPGYVVTDDHLRKLAEVGRIESGWWDGVELPADANPARARVRAALHLLIERAPAGAPVRMDNLWRGLPVDDQALIEDALNALADDERVEIECADSGVLVCVPPSQVEALKAIATGKAKSDILDALVQG